jgi:hypothetical protein
MEGVEVMDEEPILVLSTSDEPEDALFTESLNRVRGIVLKSRPTFDRLSEFAYTLNAFQPNPHLNYLIQEASTIHAQFQASLHQILTVPTVDPEVFRTMREAASGIAAVPRLEEWQAAAEAAATAASIIQELLQSIQIAIPRIDPLWSDIFLAKKGDPQAAKRLVPRISWRPNHWQKEAIHLRARSVGSSPVVIREEALIQGVMMALQGEVDDELPLLVSCQSTWLYEKDQSLATICLNDLPVATFLEWLWQEAIRAAGFWLLGMPCAPTVVLAVPPTDNSELQLAIFTSESTDKQPDNLRGRPFGSGIFEHYQAFLQEIRLAVVRLEQRGQRVTQERVAEVLFQKGLIGGQSSERQLRRWVREFGFSDWRDVLTHL